jgi:hypothetical protein
MMRFGRETSRRVSMLWLAVALATAWPAAQTPKFNVAAKADKKADFTKFKTYRWDGGWKAFDKNVHQLIVDAIDRELQAVGLEKQTASPTDVTVTYATVNRTDVDLDSQAIVNEMGRRQYSVGTLLVVMQDATTRKELFRVRAETPIDREPEKLKAAIDDVVAEMFTKYPTRTAGK